MNTDVIRQALELAKASQPHVSPVTGEENALVGIIDQALAALDAMQSVDLGKAREDATASCDTPNEAAGWDKCCDYIEENGLLGIPEGWQPIETAPRDGTLIWAWLHQSGIRVVRWYTAEEIAEHCGGIPEDWKPGWGEENDVTEEWEPRYWLPYNALPPPPQGETR